MSLYRDYDQEQLDYQYNTRAEVPDFQDFFDRWAAESAAIRDATDGIYDIAYGEGERERLDVFGLGPDAPVLVFIHGGYWRAFDKSYFSFLAPAAKRAGLALVAISYPLAPAATMDEIVDAVRRAFVWLWRHGAEHGLARERLYVAGHSAGGHLTAEIMSTDFTALDPDAPGDLVKAGFAISGLYDLEPIRLTYLNEDLRMDAETARRNSPIGHVPSGAGPLLMTVGGRESAEFHRQQADYAAAWRAAGNSAEILAADDLHHFDILDRLAEADSPLMAALCKEALKG